jgi:hypothetical protein
MKKTIPLIVAGIIFLLVAIGHLLRIVCNVVITVSAYTHPMWPSYVALIVTLLLAIWMFVASKR